MYFEFAYRFAGIWVFLYNLCPQGRLRVHLRRRLRGEDRGRRHPHVLQHPRLPGGLHYTILYYTTLHYTTLHYTILYYTILYDTIRYDTIPDCPEGACLPGECHDLANDYYY